MCDFSKCSSQLNKPPWQIMYLRGSLFGQKMEKLEKGTLLGRCFLFIGSHALFREWRGHFIWNLKKIRTSKKGDLIWEGVHYLGRDIILGGWCVRPHTKARNPEIPLPAVMVQHTLTFVFEIQSDHKWETSESNTVRVLAQTWCRKTGMG